MQMELFMSNSRCWRLSTRRDRPQAFRRQLTRAAAFGVAQHPADTLQRQEEVLRALAGWSADNLPRYASPPEPWQPSDFLPDPGSADFFENLEELAAEARNLPAEVLVVLAGLAVDASCLPNQHSLWCATPVLADVSGADQHIWARWRRGVTADRSRGRQLLLSYLSLSGCIDCAALELTCQCSIAAGPAAVPGRGCAGPYQQLMRGMLEARMLRVMFTNLARLCSFHEAANAAGIAAAIAADMTRHELAQVAAVSQLFAADPVGAVTALAQVVQAGVALTAANMDDAGWHQAHNSSSSSASQQMAEAAEAAEQQQQPPRGSSSSGSGGCSQLFVDFLATADAAGVYCIADAAAAVQEACELFQVADIAASLQHHSQPQQQQQQWQRAPAGPEAAAAAEAADLLLRHSSLLKRMAELQLEWRLRSRRRDRCRAASFSWVFGREVGL